MSDHGEQLDTQRRIGQGDAILKAIRDAFRGIKLDGGVTLAQARLMDQFGRGDIASAMVSAGPSDWTALSDDEISDSPVLNFLDATGMRFYLPAFMSWTLRKYDRSGSESVGSTIYAFLRPPHDEVFSLFDEGQRRVACQFLQFFAQVWEYGDAHLAQIALTRHGWDQFCADMLK